MRGILALAAAVGLLAVRSTNAAAQDRADFAAWFALTFTPYGALLPMVTPGMVGADPVEGRASRAVEVRYSRWSFEGDGDVFNSFGAGGRIGGVGFGAGHSQCSGCDGVFMGGVDFEAVLKTTTLGSDASASLISIGLRPAVGIGFFTDVTKLIVLSGAIDLPVSVSIPVGTAAHLVPFLSPGAGVGRISDRGESRTGTRASLAAGVGLVAANGLGVHLGWRRIFIEDGPSTLGVGISFGR